MTVTINGTTGIAGTNGSAGTPAVQGEDTNTGIFFPAADTVAVATAGAERVRVTSAGDVGLGTSSPVNIAGYTIQTINNTSSGAATYYQQNATTVGRVIATSSDFYVGGVKAGSNLILESAGTERARIDASGNLLVGTTTLQGRFTVTATGSTTIDCARTETTLSNQIVFRNGNGAVGSITTNGSSTAYNTSSDYRLKENVQPMTGALDTITQLNHVTYTWKIDGLPGQGFIAHELQAVVPDCVTGEKDAVDAEGNPQYQGVDTSFLVATLVKAIQELTARVAELEAK